MSDDTIFEFDSQVVGNEENGDLEINMSNGFEFDKPTEKPNIIKVIGVGGGGSNAVTHMFNEGIKDVDFVLCNTDYQALAVSPVSTKIHLGKRELGAGNVPSVGREAAEQSVEELRTLLSKDTKMVFVTAGMGGGTGTGGAPVVAQVAKELGILTIGIVTLPFKVEGRRRMQQALEGVENLRQHVDALLIISNDKLREEYGNMKLTEAFKKADDVLKTAAKGIAEIITVTGYVNVDFEDVNNVMRHSGKAIMGSGVAEGEDRAQRAIEEAMHSPLLNDSNIKGAKKILLYITSGDGDNEVSLDEVMQITEYVQYNCGNTAEVIWGNGKDSSLGSAVAVTLIATGFSSDDDGPVEVGKVEEIEHAIDEVEPKNTIIEKEETEPEVKVEGDDIVHSIDDDAEECKPEEEHFFNTQNEANEDEGGEIVHTLYDERPIKANPTESDANHGVSENGTRVFDNPFRKQERSNDDIFTNKAKTGMPESLSQNHVALEVIESEMDDESVKSQMRRERLRQLSMRTSTAKGLESLENQPAYVRKGLSFSNNVDDDEFSQYTSKQNGLGSNSFLHGNVD